MIDITFPLEVGALLTLAQIGLRLILSLASAWLR